MEEPWGGTLVTHLCDLLAARAEQGEEQQRAQDAHAGERRHSRAWCGAFAPTCIRSSASRGFRISARPSGSRHVRMPVTAQGPILDGVEEDLDRARDAARGWWLFRSMSASERADRLELERGESPRAYEASEADEIVRQTVDDGGNDAIRMILALLDTAPDGDGTVGSGDRPARGLGQ